MKLELPLFVGTVVATAFLVPLAGCSDGVAGAGGAAGGTQNPGGSAGQPATAGTSAGSAGRSAGGSSAQGGAGAGGRATGGTAGCPAQLGAGGLMTRADPIGGAAGSATAGAGGMTAGSGGRGAGAGGVSAGSAGQSGGGQGGGGQSGGGGISAGGTSGGSSAGTAGGGGAAEPFGPTFAGLKQILTASTPACTASDCHGVNGPNIFQMTTRDDVFLYNSLTTHVSVNCGNLKVVEPGHPELSALVKIIKGACVGPCTTTPRMPKDCTPEMETCLPDMMISSVEQWIAAGALH